MKHLGMYTTMVWNMCNKNVKGNRRKCISKTFMAYGLSTATIASFALWNFKKTLTYNSMKQPNCPSLMQGRGVPTFKTRNDLPKIMQEEGFQRGIELGVQHGGYAHGMLSTWTNCTEYHLVDLWGHQENYVDYANVNQERQDQIYQGAMKKLAAYGDKIHVCRNYTTVCAVTYDNEYFDFIYVDARHDFKGVWDDLVAYWPKLKVGGIIAGHDYVTNDDGPLPRQDWSKNYDGTIDETGTVVKGAVDKFAASVCRQVTVSYREKAWNTWAMRK